MILGIIIGAVGMLAFIVVLLVIQEVIMKFLKRPEN